MDNEEKTIKPREKEEVKELKDAETGAEKKSKVSAAAQSKKPKTAAVSQAKVKTSEQSGEKISATAQSKTPKAATAGKTKAKTAEAKLKIEPESEAVIPAAAEEKIETSVASQAKVNADENTAVLKAAEIEAKNSVKRDESITVVEDTADSLSEEAVQETEKANYTAKTLSPGRLVLKRFFRSKLSVIGLALVIILFLFSFVGPLFSPWTETEIDDTPVQGPVVPIEITFTVIEIVDGVETEVEYTSYDLTSDILSTNIRAKPSKSHWFGTDKDGRDVLTRLMYGGRISLIIGFVVVFLQTLIGVIFGSLAGYFGKWVDQIIMRIVDIFNCVPTLPLLLIVSALYDAWDTAGVLEGLKGFMGLGDKLRIVYLMVIMVFFGWVGTARIVRGQILSLREQEFMVAAESIGLSSGRKIAKHLIPNVLPQLIVSMTLALGGIILYEATLSWLNLGVPMPYAAWGSMINAASDPDILANFFHIWVPPGICIILAVLGFNFVGDGLRDAFDPRMKR